MRDSIGELEIVMSSDEAHATRRAYHEAEKLRISELRKASRAEKKAEAIAASSKPEVAKKHESKTKVGPPIPRLKTTFKSFPLS
jgi:sRNA-binding protein